MHDKGKKITKADDTALPSTQRLVSSSIHHENWSGHVAATAAE